MANPTYPSFISSEGAVDAGRYGVYLGTGQFKAGAPTQVVFFSWAGSFLVPFDGGAMLDAGSGVVFGGGAGRIDNDGVDDVVTCSYSGCTFTFSKIDVLQSLPTGGNTGIAPRPVVVADVDGDGRNDVLVGKGTSHVVYSFLQQLPYQFPTSSVIATDSNSVDALALADVDGDGALDALAYDRGQAAFYVLHNERDGGFTPGLLAGQIKGGSYGGLATGYIDGDCRTDAVTSGTGGVFVHLNHNGSFDQVTDAGFSLASSTSSAETIRLADINFDGTLDVVMLVRLGNNSYELRTMLGRGDGTFTAGPARTFLGTDTTSDMVVGNFDSDPDLEIAVYNGHTDGNIGGGTIYFFQVNQ